MQIMRSIHGIGNLETRVGAVSDFARTLEMLVEYFLCNIMHGLINIGVISDIASV